MMDYFSLTFKWIIPRTSRINGGLQWSCEIEVSHMGKKLISYRQRWEKFGPQHIRFAELGKNKSNNHISQINR